MRTIILVLTILTLIVLITGCKKDNLCTACETATLYYIPKCATIKGYVKLDKSNETYVFQHDIDEKFRKSGINVCITYDYEGSKLLTADCTQGQVIKINCIDDK